MISETEAKVQARIPWEQLNWIATLCLPILAVAVTYGTYGQRLQTVEHLTEEQRVYHHITREEVGELIQHEGPYVADRDSIRTSLTTLSAVQAGQAAQLAAIRSDLGSTQIRQERIETKLDVILGEVRRNLPKTTD